LQQISSTTTDKQGFYAVDWLRADADLTITAEDHEVVDTPNNSPDFVLRGDEDLFMFDLVVEKNTNSIVPVCGVCVENGLPEEPHFPDECLFTFLTSKEVTVLNSLDPNDKEGPGNEGEGDLISLGQILDYTIHFENAAGPNTLPANQVVVEDGLEEDLDPLTFDMQSVQIGIDSFGMLDLDDSSSGYSQNTLLDFRSGASGKQRDIAINVDWVLDLSTRRIVWTLETDTINGDQPLPEDGFLAPGEKGSISFRIAPSQAAVIGTVIENQATIRFDGGAPIETGTWRNEIGNVSTTDPGEVSVPPVEEQSCARGNERPQATNDTVKDDVEVAGTPALSWLSIPNARSYRVLFATQGQPLEPLANVAQNKFVGNLPIAPGNSYEWRVDALFSPDCETQGPVWRFKSVASSFRRGDVNSDTELDITDPLKLLTFLFLGGDPLPCEDAADIDDNSQLEITDAFVILRFLFLGFHPAVPLNALCAADGTDDELQVCEVSECTSEG
jgi:hypothetical protein